MRYLLILMVACVLAGCNLGNATPTPAPTPDIPTVQILAPLNNSKVIEGTDFTIDIIARDNGTGVSRIALFVDGEEINSANPVQSAAVPELRVEMNWLAQGVGLHIISAIAYRLDGTRGDETLINVEVVAGE